MMFKYTALPYTKPDNGWNTAHIPSFSVSMFHRSLNPKKLMAFICISDSQHTVFTTTSFLKYLKNPCSDIHSKSMSVVTRVWTEDLKVRAIQYCFYIH